MQHFFFEKIVRSLKIENFFNTIPKHDMIWRKYFELLL